MEWGKICRIDGDGKVCTVGTFLMEEENLSLAQSPASSQLKEFLNCCNG